MSRIPSGLSFWIVQILWWLGVAALEMKVDFLNPVFGLKTIEDVVKVSSTLVSDRLLDSWLHPGSSLLSGSVQA